MIRLAGTLALVGVVGAVAGTVGWKLACALDDWRRGEEEPW